MFTQQVGHLVNLMIQQKYTQKITTSAYTIKPGMRPHAGMNSTLAHLSKSPASNQQNPSVFKYYS